MRYTVCSNHGGKGNMKQDELQSIVSDLVEELRELPDRTDLTTWQLMDRAGYANEELSNEGLMDIDYALRQAARKAHITLDGSKHDGKVEGLPFNLDYIVRNAKAQIRCPRCGSYDTARILYGRSIGGKDARRENPPGRLLHQFSGGKRATRAHRSNPPLQCL